MRLRPSSAPSYPALSVRQPWAWAIVNAGKDVENRTWQTAYRGPLLIHASTYNPSSAEMAGFFSLYESATGLRAEGFEEMLEVVRRVRGELRYGGVIGQVELVDCVRNSASPWAERGMVHWTLACPCPLPFAAGPGQLGLFRRRWKGDS